MAYLPTRMILAQHLSAIPAMPPVAPSNVYDLGPGMQFNMDTGSLIYNGMNIPVIPGLLSALVVRAILFGGGLAASHAKGYLKRKRA